MSGVPPAVFTNVGSLMVTVATSVSPTFKVLFTTLPVAESATLEIEGGAMSTLKLS